MERKLTKKRIRAIFDYGYYTAMQEISTHKTLRVNKREELVRKLGEKVSK